MYFHLIRTTAFGIIRSFTHKVLLLSYIELFPNSRSILLILVLEKFWVKLNLPHLNIEYFKKGLCIIPHCLRVLKSADIYSQLSCESPFIYHQLFISESFPTILLLDETY